MTDRGPPYHNAAIDGETPETRDPRHNTGVIPLAKKIPDGHEFQFEFLTDRPITTAAFGKSPRRLALKFALAGAADIGADHEAKQMLGVDAFSVHAVRQQHRKTHDRGSKRFCIDRHSHSENR